MMHHLDTGDMRLLDEVLSHYLQGLRDELAHTDKRELRDELRARHDLVEALRRRLTTPPAPTLDA